MAWSSWFLKICKRTHACRKPMRCQIAVESRSESHEACDCCFRCPYVCKCFDWILICICKRVIELCHVGEISHHLVVPRQHFVRDGDACQLGADAAEHEREHVLVFDRLRSEERRVGKECRSR